MPWASSCYALAPATAQLPSGHTHAAQAECDGYSGYSSCWQHWSQMYACPDIAHATSHPLTDPSVLQYEADSAPALALNASIERTEKRFATYAKQGLLCGTDGLPHLISDPGLAIRYGHTGETLVSNVLLVLKLRVRDLLPVNAGLMLVLHTLHCYAAVPHSIGKFST